MSDEELIDIQIFGIGEGAGLGRLYYAIKQEPV